MHVYKILDFVYATERNVKYLGHLKHILKLILYPPIYLLESHMHKINLTITTCGGFEK